MSGWTGLISVWFDMLRTFKSWDETIRRVSPVVGELQGMMFLVPGYFSLYNTVDSKAKQVFTNPKSSSRHLVL